MAPDATRRREFWNERDTDFTLSEPGWFGAGEALNDRIDAGKRQAMRRAIAGIGLTRDRRWAVLDAGCGHRHFARFDRDACPSTSSVGVDISEPAITHLQREIPAPELRLADRSVRDDLSEPTQVTEHHDVARTMPRLENPSGLVAQEAARR